MNQFPTSAVSDPMWFSTPGKVCNRNTDGLSQFDPRLVPGENTAVFVLYGQSNSPGACWVEADYAPTNTTKVQVLNAFDGGIYQCADPLVGAQNGVDGSWGARVADALIDGEDYDRVILVPASLSSLRVADCAGPGTLYFPMMLAAARRCAALSLPITAFILHLGESDKRDGTAQADFTTRAQALIDGIRAEGFDAPWLVCTTSWIDGAPGSDIQAAQADLIDEGAGIYAGANTDTLGNSYRQIDDETHFTDAGGIAAAALLVARIRAVL